MKYFEGVEDIHNRVSMYWNLSKLIPIPRFNIKCGACQSDDLLMRQLAIRDKSDSPSRYRADIIFKCKCCSGLKHFGIVIPEAFFKQHEMRGKLRYNFHELKKLWKEIKDN